jgi:small subunit ribosomal protein S6
LTLSSRRSAISIEFFALILLFDSLSIFLNPAPIPAIDGMLIGANYSPIVQRESHSMSKQPTQYETTFVVNAAFDDNQIDAVIEKVKDVVTKNGGEIRDLAKWGRKRFAYPIKKKNNGFYVVCEFSAPGDVIAKLERHYQLDESIIRYLTIALDKKALQSRIKPSDLLKAATPEAPAPAAATAAAPVAVEPVAAPVTKTDAAVKN